MGISTWPIHRPAMQTESASRAASELLDGPILSELPWPRTGSCVSDLSHFEASGRVGQYRREVRRTGPQGGKHGDLIKAWHRRHRGFFVALGATCRFVVVAA